MGDFQRRLPERDLEWNEGDAPRVGLGGTVGGFGMDRHPVTVMWVSNDGKTVKVDNDDYVSVGACPSQSESQQYEYYEPKDQTSRADPSAWSTYTLRENGRWVQKGDDMRRGRGLTLGVRNRWYNPSY